MRRTLGEVADFYGGASLPEGEAFSNQSEGYLLLRVSDLNLPQNSVYVTKSFQWSAKPGQKSATAPEGSLVIPKRGGAIGTNKKRITTRDCILDPNLMAIHPHKELDVRFLYHWFRTFDLLDISSGTTVPQLNKQDLHPLQLPIPSVEEQCRIAEVLDKADELRAKRRRAIALLDELAQSIFHQIFGNGKNAPDWPVEALSVHLTESSRNGLSPSTGGSIEEKVLTLSAITGAAFDETAFKVSTFTEHPPKSKRVNHRDLLVCRGNGNLHFVGLGFFPRRDMPDTVFPDTMIAARINYNALDREYLEYAWRTKFVRTQIESGARTTNGTFKINQKVLNSLRIPIPPIDIQKDFGHRIRSLEAAKETQKKHLAKLDELFVSLQSRAFRGKL
ncbi:restriction endonuclease subunit S [Streptosporangium algeriense]|uniref:Restriction endonuclease subunit S n=1 Tax=Streptosporangium algeriense TaxID=1682748 RepID=A0ABW3DGN6_9ACTN